MVQFVTPMRLLDIEIVKGISNSVLFACYLHLHTSACCSC